MKMSEIENKLSDFLRNYLVNSGQKSFVVGVSGGVDSAVVASLCAKIAPTFALVMPTKTSNKRNLHDALDLIKNLGIKYELIEIDGILSEFLRTGKDTDKIRTGNFAARIRMSLLYDYSAKCGGLVVGTSNKSEIILGYGTLHGDLAYALNPLGNLLKSDVFTLAKYLGVSENIINKAPSADLWEGQSDEGEFGFTYAQIDEFITQIESEFSSECADLVREVEFISRGEFGLLNSDAKLTKFVVSRARANKFKICPAPIAQI